MIFFLMILNTLKNEYLAIFCFKVCAKEFGNHSVETATTYCEEIGNDVISI